MMSESQSRTTNMQSFYVAEDPEITETTRSILTEYSGVPENEIVQHIRGIRDRAWREHNYPCLGRYAFLNFSISNSPHYEKVVQQLKSDKDTTLIDIGCCFGQDIRKLVFDGAPSSQLAGSELKPIFIDLGYELFKDKGKLQATFNSEDFFAEPTEKSKLKPGLFNFIHAASFFHLFGYDEQVEAVGIALKMLKPVPGAMVFGRQVGWNKPGEVQYQASRRSGEMYRHNRETMRKCFEEAAEKVCLKVQVDVSKGDEVRKSDDMGEVSYFTFSITRV